MTCSKQQIIAFRLARLVGLLLILASTRVAPAQVPQMISYQGFLEDGGTPVNDPSATLTFRLYDAATGGTVLWTETQTGVAITDGVFDVLIGSTTSLAGVNFGDPLWLSVAVGDASASELSPRSELAAAPYSLGLRLPFAATGSTPAGTSLLTLTQTGDDNAARLVVNNTSSTKAALYVETDAPGGSAGRFVGQLQVTPGVTTGSPLLVAGVVESTTGGLKLPDGTIIDESGDLGGGLPTTGTGAYDLTNDEGILAAGTLGTGSIPTAGAGTRLLWYPAKAAFRAGQVVGNQWDDTNIGTRSVALGLNTIASGDESTVGGGSENTASGNVATVGGGWENMASGPGATVGGGRANASSAFRSTVSGGSSNTASADWATVGGGASNRAEARYATIGGGGVSTLGDPSTANRVYDEHGTIGGGANNQAGSDDGVLANHRFATVAGGIENTASGNAAIVGGGSQNMASGSSSMVLGGLSNEANGNYSFAAGWDAHADHARSFVWNDGQVGTPLSTTAPFQFVIGAVGGVIIEGPVHPRSDDTYSLGQSGSRWTGVWATDGTINTSDRRAKRDIEPLTHGLNDVLNLRPVRYRWKDRPEAGPRLGLIAQEVEEILPEVVRRPTGDDRLLGMSYAELVPVLVRALQEQQAEIEALKAQTERLDHLEEQIDMLKALLNQ